MFAELISHGLETLDSRLLTSTSRWASKYIQLGNPFPGPLSYSHHPWMREMLDAQAEVCVGQKAAQLGYSTYSIAVALKTIADGRNVLYLLPTRTPDASDFSISRFDKIIESSAYLSNLFHRNKSVGIKRADQGVVYIRGMNSASALKSVDVSLLVFDEVDEMPEGKIPLAQQRLAGQLVKRSIYISTPTVPDFGINKLLKDSTESHFFFKCPGCSRLIELTWPENFELCGESHTDPACKQSYIKCADCGYRLEHQEKANWLKNAKFIRTRDSEVLGYYINQLYSATVTPEELARAYFRAQIDLAAEQEFYNSMLGLAKVLQGARILEDEIRACQGAYTSAEKTPRGKLVTIGVDIGKLLHFNVDQWSFDAPCADLNLSAHCKTLNAGAVTSFNELQHLIVQYRPACVVIDSEPETRKALEFAATNPGLVHLCKFTRSDVENTITGTLLLKVNRTAWLDTALSRYKTGRILLPADLPNEYFVHLMALVRRYRRSADGDLIGHYISTGPDHSAFARVYSEIALVVGAAKFYNKDVRELL